MSEKRFLYMNLLEEEVEKRFYANMFYILDSQMRS